MRTQALTAIISIDTSTLIFGGNFYKICIKHILTWFISSENIGGNDGKNSNNAEDVKNQPR